jgi:hypothetical protein
LPNISRSSSDSITPSLSLDGNFCGGIDSLGNILMLLVVLRTMGGIFI